MKIPKQIAPAFKNFSGAGGSKNTKNDSGNALKSQKYKKLSNRASERTTLIKAKTQNAKPTSTKGERGTDNPSV
ncbi:MAG: hypothetical protein DHS20C02_19890 [Micavibrio sp.]|nr:MAG: hypothetical protein DHS20C02_19890 [Micavibrio sp.]